MKSNRLIIVFVKNLKLGKVKTRLAKDIGDAEALFIYDRLVEITQVTTEKLDMDKHIYFSDFVTNDLWSTDYKTIQHGKDLGERMKNAFEGGFNMGYTQVVLIGSDLPDISKEIIANAFKHLDKNDAVFGPAEDGGYYLIGLTKTLDFIFENKPWSQPNLLDITLAQLNERGISAPLLNTLNDIDTFEDLKKSKLYDEYLKQKKLND